MKYSILAIALTLALASPNAQQKTDPGGSQNSQDHAAGVKARGTQVMGFSQDKATHHFILFPDGGAIQIEAKSASDTTTRDQIQMHLAHIAQMFADGNFQAPMLIHDKVPPGVPTLERLKAAITYKFEKLDSGGRVRITTKNPEALSAIYEFLRFQIADHQTGDSTLVTQPK
ncbi:MAG TPA: hypothetical protein VGZ48_00815 [Candidatus Acidoferrales bacterium]|jgi:hypothetical protein|nr:hypothetical protein [Candidatus Acidoferrales bacterium]